MISIGSTILVGVLILCLTIGVLADRYSVSDSVSCFICADCPRPIPVHTDSVITLDNCGECFTTKIDVISRFYYVRGCLPPNLSCDKYRTTYNLPYPVERMLNLTVPYDDKYLQNVTHYCCKGDYCNNSRELRPTKAFIFAVSLFYFLCISLM